MILDQVSGNTVYFKVFVKPLVNFIWLAGFVFLAGSLIAMWPDAREQRRLGRAALARPSVIELILGGLIAVAAVLIVALPFLRDTGEPELIDTSADEELLALLEARDHALAALKELEFDHRIGNVDDADYRASVGPLRRAGGRGAAGARPRPGAEARCQPKKTW